MTVHTVVFRGATDWIPCDSTQPSPFHPPADGLLGSVVVKCGTLNASAVVSIQPLPVCSKGEKNNPKTKPGPRDCRVNIWIL